MSVLGYYVNCDDALCLDCFQEHYGDDDNGRDDSPGFVKWRTGGGFESWSEPAVIFSDGESDTPTHCVECHELIAHALTPDGYKYVEEHAREHIKDAIEPDRTTPPLSSLRVVEDWLEEYGNNDINGYVIVLHAALLEAAERNEDDDEDEEPYDHSRAKEDRRNAYMLAELEAEGEQ